MSEDIEDHIIKTIRNNVKHVHVMSNFSGVKIGDKAKGSKDGEIGV